MVNTTTMSSRRRGSRTAAPVSNGAPTTTPSAYAEIRWPAWGILTCRLPAMFGSSPKETNSPVPMPKPPRARASNAHLTGPIDTVRRAVGILPAG